MPISVSRTGLIDVICEDHNHLQVRNWELGFLK